MMLSRNFIVLLLVAFLGITRNVIAKEIPNCEFSDTVDLTGSPQLGNGSYIYEGIIVPKEDVGTYDYEILAEGARISVPEHKRGCVCKNKSCVKFCCHPRHGVKVDEARECSTDLVSDLKYSSYINVTMANGEVKLVDVEKEFVIQAGIPCEASYALSPEMDDRDQWILYENGSLLRVDDSMLMSKHDYCLNPHSVNGTYYLNPVNCAEIVRHPANLQVNTIIITLSIPFLVLTAIVYAWIRELRNLHGKCLICYLLALAIGYSGLAGNTWKVIITEEPLTGGGCMLLAYTVYFFFLSAFLWLSIISFDLWYHFKGTNSTADRFMKRQRFLKYSMVAWSVPTIITITTFFIQMFAGLDAPFDPDIGREVCWVNYRSISAMIYFYGIVLFVIIFNIVMFTMTSLKIYHVKKELNNVSRVNSGRRSQQSENDNFGLFLRLFVVMGISWLFEVFSYLIGIDATIDSHYSWIFYAFDAFNSAQGIIIFVLFVLKPKVRMLIKKQCNSGGRFGSYMVQNGSSGMSFRTRGSQKSNSRTQYSGVSTTDTSITSKKSSAV